MGKLASLTSADKAAVVHKLANVFQDENKCSQTPARRLPPYVCRPLTIRCTALDLPSKSREKIPEEPTSGRVDWGLFFMNQKFSREMKYEGWALEDL